MPSYENKRTRNNCLTEESSRYHYGEIDCVDFSVTFTYEYPDGSRLVRGDAIQVYMPSGSQASLLGLSQFENKVVRVKGLIEEYEGFPLINVTEQSNIGKYTN